MSSVTRPKYRLLGLVSTAAILAAAMFAAPACGPAEPSSPASTRGVWAEMRDADGFRRLSESPEFCSECVKSEAVAVLGAASGSGNLSLEAFTGEAVRDSHGNYWVSQMRTILVFSPAGELIAEVGRAGQGPMEFQYASPFYADDAGRVYILDSVNNRETTVGPDFQVFRDGRLPPGSFTAAAPLARGNRYVLQMWVETAERVGLPLHVSEGSEILHSFGRPVGAGSIAQDRQAAMRLLATDGQDHIFSAEYYEYSIEAWTPTGERIGGFRGPPLNDPGMVLGSWSADTPPVSRIRGIHADDADRLWVARWQVRPDWLDATTERIGSDGRPLLVVKDNDMRRIFDTHIDVVDLNSSSIVASGVVEGVFTKFLDDGLTVAMSQLADGTGVLVVSRLEWIP